MLTEKTKNFIEKIAANMQKQLKMEFPNKYDLEDVVEFVESMGCEVCFGSSTNSYSVKDKKSTIYLTFDKKCSEQENINDVLKVLFHEIWHFISDRIFGDTYEDAYSSNYSDLSINPQEASANYFSRAMLFPENAFVNDVIDKVDSRGMCNIFSVAELFSMSYMNVIARGNDLSLWNKKGGI